MKASVFRRAARVGAGAAVASTALLAVAAGLLDGASAGVPAASHVALTGGILALVIASVAGRLEFEEPSARAQRVSFWLRSAPTLIDVQLGFALLAGVHAAVATTGGADSPLYPLLYGVVAFVATFSSRRAALAVVAAAVALELAALLRAPAPQAAWVATVVRCAFIVAAAGAHSLFLRGLVARQRRRHEDRLRAEVSALRQEARDYRLISAALTPDSRAPRSRAEEERKLAEGAVESVRASVFYTLGLIKRSLEARTCALLWLDASGEQLKLKEVVSESDAVTERRAVPLAGALRAIVRDGKALTLPSVKWTQLPYYEIEQEVGAFVGVPVVDGAHLRGILCADRSHAFDERDVAILNGATEQIIRAVQSEQVFQAVERGKYEMERFYRASEMLCRALTLEQVMETAFDAAAQMVDYDVAAIALYDRSSRKHRVSRVRTREDARLVDVDRLDGLEFRENAGLASMVVKNKHYLPATGVLRDQTTPIYTKKIKLRDAESLLVLPLLCADEAVGTFTLASRRPRQFGKDVREMLGIIANQVGVSLQNAKMYKKMETMATTDGLTGLTNHRAFQERFGDLLARAARHGHAASIILTDVDHFKKVNDTYGHPVGDEVLRRVARVLGDNVRKIDIVARYGGEEFVIVLEATGLDGAVQIADRIRQDIARQTFESDQGSFSCTMSFGVAEFPADGDDREALIEHADCALYHAKESGRNRVVSWREFEAARSKRAS